MKQGELTDRARLATTGTMQGGGGRMCGTWRMTAAVPVMLALGGCITVNAPEEPIVIELNVNIRQDVIYRLAEDAGNTIEETADIF